MTAHEALARADAVLKECLSDNDRSVTDVIAEALLNVESEVEAKYANAVVIPVGWKLLAVREPAFGEYFLSDDRTSVEYHDGRVNFRGRNAARLILGKES